MSKIVLFEYFLKKLIDWYCDYYGIELNEFNDHSFNNLSKLKVIKLHFFACSTSEEALNIFDDFHAMPYGHVESGVYNRLNELTFFTIGNAKLTINDLNGLQNVQIDSVIDDAVNNLKKINPSLISLDPFDLVELSHKWFSWRYSFQQARKIGQYSKPISPQLIIQETKFYAL